MTEEFGNYETSYFVMNVPIKADLEIRNMSDEDFAVFFHEYIHFLQDISSFYSYMDIYRHGEYMRRALKDIYISPKKFTIPLELEEKGDNVILNKKIAEISLGDKEELKCVIIEDIFVEEYSLTNSFSIPELHVLALTNQGQEEIVVGAYAIRENMAYLLERKCTTKYRTSCDYPYQIVELLASKMCPKKLTKLDLIALCDMSLQCSVPGYAIYKMLEAIANNNMIVKKPEDLYDFILSKKVIFLDEEIDMRNALKKASLMATNHLLSYVKIAELSQEYKDWISSTMLAGIGLRIQQPYFFLDMARGKRNKENIVLQYIAKNIGSPQMVNILGKRFQLATDRPICRFEFLEVVREIERLFEHGVRQCSLRPWCAMSQNGSLVDKRCENAPWERCNDDALCPYGALWRHWGLAEYKVIIKNV